MTGLRRRERPWILTQTGPLTRFGLSILGLIYDWQHRHDTRR